MSNHLSMSHQQAIIGLIERGWSQHRIARELALDRKSFYNPACGLSRLEFFQLLINPQAFPADELLYEREAA